MFSAARSGEPFPLPITVRGDGLRDGACDAADRARVCQRIGERLRRLRADHLQLAVLLIDLGLPPDGYADRFDGQCAGSRRRERREAVQILSVQISVRPVSHRRLVAPRW